VNEETNPRKEKIRRWFTYKVETCPKLDAFDSLFGLWPTMHSPVPSLSHARVERWSPWVYKQLQVQLTDSELMIHSLHSPGFPFSITNNQRVPGLPDDSMSQEIFSTMWGLFYYAHFCRWGSDLYHLLKVKGWQILRLLVKSILNPKPILLLLLNAVQKQH
jgi:hypothetical protein